MYTLYIFERYYDKNKKKIMERTGNFYINEKKKIMVNLCRTIFIVCLSR